MFRDFPAQKPYPMFRDFLEKSHPFQRHTPVHHIRRVPPPPPPRGWYNIMIRSSLGLFGSWEIQDRTFSIFILFYCMNTADGFELISWYFKNYFMRVSEASELRKFCIFKTKKVIKKTCLIFLNSPNFLELFNFQKISLKNHKFPEFRENTGVVIIIVYLWVFVVFSK